MTQRIEPGAVPQYLGKKGVEFGGLDTFPTPKGISIVRMTSDEVTSLCPITGQPDFEVVDITYAPLDKCLESKSLKLYLHALRHTAAFIEALSAAIAGDIVRAIAPRWVRVATTQKARGGISIVAVAILERSHLGDIYEPVEDTAAVYAPPSNPYLGH